jgi:hypothetical protein
LQKPNISSSAPVVPHRELSDIAHPNVRQTPTGRWRSQTVKAGSINTEDRYAGSRRLYAGRPFARAEAWAHSGYHRRRGENAGAQPDSVTVSLVETAKNSKGKGGVLFSEMPAR